MTLDNLRLLIKDVFDNFMETDVIYVYINNNIYIYS